MNKKKEQEISTAPAVGGRTPPRTPPACTRFNNQTWQEREQWLATYRPIYEQIYKRPLKCIYGTPREIANTKFAPQQSILVIEMNNDENRIIGIGEIKNQTASEVYRNPSAVVSFPPSAVVPLSPSAVVSLATAHSTPTSGTVLNPDKNDAANTPTSGTVLNPDKNDAANTPTSGTVLNPDKNDAANRLPSQGGGTPGGTPTANRAELPSLGGGTPGGTPLKYKIFSDRNYSRYIYIGNTYYATRDELIRNHTTDAQYINEQLINQLPSPQTPHHQEPNQHTESVIKYLEQILFKGPKHMKRGSGITRIPTPQTPQSGHPTPAVRLDRRSTRSEE